jgi:hypothetical protein
MAAILINPIAYKVSLPNYAQLAGQWVGVKDDPILVKCNACDAVYNLIEPEEATGDSVEYHKGRVQDFMNREHPDHPTPSIQFS